MARAVLVAGFALALVLMLEALPTQASPVPARCPQGIEAASPGLLATIIEEFGPEHAPRALRIAGCESSFDLYATHPETNAAGVFQFIPETWTWVCEAAGVSCDLRARYDGWSNVHAAAYLALEQRGGGWHHWVCQG
jgi:hypothetical protein